MPLTNIEGFDWLNDLSLAYATAGTLNTEQKARYAGGRSVLMDGSGTHVEFNTGDTAPSGTVGVSCFLKGLPGSDNLDIIKLQPSNNLNLAVQTDGSVAVIDADNNVVGSSAASKVSSETWHYIEWKYILSNSTPDINEVLVDGTSVLTISAGSDTKSASAGTTLNAVQLTNDNTGLVNFDDFYRTTYDQNYLGAIRVVALYPVGDFSTQWEAAGTNFDEVDETGSPDEDTTFVLTTGTNRLDLYVVGDLPTSATSVGGIQVVTRARRSGSDPASFSPVFRTDATANEMSQNSLSTSYQYFLSVTGENPDTSSPFTVSEINNLRIGPKSFFS